MSDAVKTLASLPADLAAALDAAAGGRRGAKSAIMADALRAHLRSTGIAAGLGAAHAAYRRHRDVMREALEDVQLVEHGDGVHEAHLLCEALSGVAEHMALTRDAEDYAACATTTIYATVSDALRLGGEERWGVDAQSMLTRLRELTPIQALAVLDAVDRFWALGGVDAPSALRAVGLVS